MSDNSRFIIAAYTVTWVCFVAYAVRLHLVARRARAQYDEATRAGGESGRGE
jgi:hypothetical protein